jgi:WhiB family transcriptional regulator, redox-sensing transcriptional regulator
MNHTPSSSSPRSLGDFTWHERAACQAGPDPDLFFPHPDQTEQIRAAKTLCEQCPVRRTCLDAALEDGDRHGIRGGLTEEEREPLHRDLPHRLDHARVAATLGGRDVHLTDLERHAVVRAAYEAGEPSAHVARMLKISDDHVAKLYRRFRRQLRNRTLSQVTTPPQQATAPLSRDDVGPAA